MVHDLQQCTEQCFYLKSVYVIKLFLKRLQTIQPNKKPFHEMYRFVVVATPTHLSWAPPWYHGRWGMIWGESLPLYQCRETGHWGILPCAPVAQAESNSHCASAVKSGNWGTSTVSQGMKACPPCWWSSCCTGGPPLLPEKHSNQQSLGDSLVHILPRTQPKWNSPKTIWSRGFWTLPEYHLTLRVATVEKYRVKHNDITTL